MYEWRKMTPEQREEALRVRKLFGLPWHGPPHFHGERVLFHVTAACYEHKPVIGRRSNSKKPLLA